MLRDSVVPRCRVDSVEGVRLVEGERRVLICSDRDSLCTRERAEVDGFSRVVERVVLPESSGDRTDGVRVVGVCRLALSCSNRDSLWTRELDDEEGFFGVADGVVIFERARVRVLRGDGVRGENTRERVVELFVDGWPLRVPILRERDRPDDCDREVLGDGVV